eukprot:scaffold1448_cov71-Skeletonema_dohrnii-CCMP3373.AAC.1
MMFSVQLANKHQRLSSLLLLLPTAARALSTTSSSPTIINHLLHRPHLTHSYYSLRHGQSLANVAKIISSDPQISTVQHGLSDVGQEQATLAGKSFAKQYLNASSSSSKNDDYKGVAIFSSDFTRARETATLFTQQLHNNHQIPIYTNDIVLETRLRERYFGELNGGPDDQYQKVWDVDCVNPNHDEFGVEAANCVLERTTRLVTELDELLSSTSSSGDGGSGEEQKWKVVLVAHGDVLQIMQTGFLRHEDAARHRSLEHLETATIRELILN